MIKKKKKNQDYDQKYFMNIDISMAYIKGIV